MTKDRLQLMCPRGDGESEMEYYLGLIENSWKMTLKEGVEET